MNVSLRRIYAVVNPEAALGKTRHLWPKLRNQLQDRIGTFPWDWTTAPMQAAALVQSALQQGHDLIVSVGGDGTHNEVTNGFFKDGTILNPRAALAIVSCGSGGDLSRSLGLTTETTSALGAILSGRERQVDVGHLKFTQSSGETSERFFLNIASLGLPALVCRLLGSQPRFLGGSGRFLLATVRALIKTRSEKVTLEIDGKALPSQLVNTMAAANGQFFGGGMQVAPHAQLDDGLLDVVVIGPVGLVDFLCWGLRFYRGQHLSHPRIQYFKANTIGAFSRAPIPVETDGETIGTLPATFTVLPRGLRLLLPGN
jgi:YegS/Rv2252/BmrU family lipid kinase